MIIAFNKKENLKDLTGSSSVPFKDSGGLKELGFRYVYIYPDRFILVR